MYSTGPRDFVRNKYHFNDLWRYWVNKAEKVFYFIPALNQRIFASGQLIQKKHVSLPWPVVFPYPIISLLPIYETMGISHTIYWRHQVSFEACLKRISPIEELYILFKWFLWHLSYCLAGEHEQVLWIDSFSHLVLKSL